ncbi:BatD family protein [Thiohalocapsa sp.]|uniref:BatD family protein n=1 Tax=Thiohalocapsa sp. TaxID=2497641 RepID=UPI0025DCF923|nr:BatD family protein [Thiohalocapsa sp.]
MSILRGQGGPRRATVPALLLLGLCLAHPGTVAAVEARLSANSVAAGQPVTLTLADTAPLPVDIDLGPLAAAFRVLDQRRAETVSTVDGRRRERHELILTLLPQRTGQVSVPPLAVGDQRTAALSLSVSATTTPDAQLLPSPAEAPQPSGADMPPQRIDVIADVDPPAGVVGQELVLTIRVRSPEGPPLGHLPTPQASAARLLPLVTTRAPEPDGATVLMHRYSVFPERAGKLRISELGFDAWQPAGGAPVRHRAEPLEVTVSAPPADADLDTWLPARALTLTEAGPSEVRIAPGQGLERLITLRAEGLPADELPALPLAIPFQLRVRDDPPRLWNERTATGIVGFRAERVLISAAEPGSYVLPGPAIDWWDTGTDQRRTARLPDWTLTVAPFASADRRPAAQWARDQQTPEDAGAATAAPAESPLGRGEPSTPKPAAGGPWGMLAVGGLGLLLALLLGWLTRRWLRRRDAVPQTATAAVPAAPYRSDEMLPALIAAVRHAYDKADADAARDALLAWAAVVWPERPPGNLSQLMLRLPSPLRDDLKLLDMAFYGPGGSAWAGRPVAAQLPAITPLPEATPTAADEQAPA